MINERYNRDFRNTTLSKKIAKKSGYKFINNTFRQLKTKYSLTFEEILKLSETDDKYDIELDKYNVKLASEGRIVFGSRLSIWLLKDSAQNFKTRISLKASSISEGTLHLGSSSCIPSGLVIEMQ